MATIIDFENPGSLGVFINETVISGLETLNNTIKLINIVTKKLYVEKYFPFKKNAHFNKK